MWRNGMEYKYMFLFPLRNLARKGLSVLVELCAVIGWCPSGGILGSGPSGYHLSEPSIGCLGGIPAELALHNPPTPDTRGTPKGFYRPAHRSETESNDLVPGQIKSEGWSHTQGSQDMSQ